MGNLRDKTQRNDLLMVVGISGGKSEGPGEKGSLGLLKNDGEPILHCYGGIGAGFGDFKSQKSRSTH